MIANRKGFSLIGTLMAMAVSVIILMGVMYLITDVYEAKQQINSQATIDTFHAASLQTIRNSTRIRTITGVDTDPNLEACLGGRGINCTTFENLGARAFDPAGLNLNGAFSSQGVCPAGPTGPSCNISRNASFRFECPTATTCTAIRILTTTNYIRSARTPASVQNVTGRTSTITIPGALLASRNSIDFSCGSTQLITRVDYKNLRGVCSTVTGNVSSPNLEPLRSFGPTAPTTVYQETLADSSCPSTGFGAIGLYSAQTSCQAAPPPPVPTNCIGSWSACSLACGGGTQTYSILTLPKNGGNTCPFSQGQTQACNTQACAPTQCLPHTSYPFCRISFVCAKGFRNPRFRPPTQTRGVQAFFNITAPIRGRVNVTTRDVAITEPGVTLTSWSGGLALQCKADGTWQQVAHGFCLVDKMLPNSDPRCIP